MHDDSTRIFFFSHVLWWGERKLSHLQSLCEDARNHWTLPLVSKLLCKPGSFWDLINFWEVIMDLQWKVQRNVISEGTNKNKEPWRSAWSHRNSKRIEPSLNQKSKLNLNTSYRELHKTNCSISELGKYFSKVIWLFQIKLICGTLKPG